MGKETLLGIGVIAIAQGVNTLATDIVVGCSMVVVGLVILFVRGQLKLK